MSEVEIKIESPEVDENLLAELSCSITLMIYKHPVVTSDGQIYEKEAITGWLKKHSTSPNTGKRITKKLIDIPFVKNKVSELLKKYPHLITEQYVNEIVKVISKSTKLQYILQPYYQNLKLINVNQMSVRYTKVLFSHQKRLNLILQKSKQTPEVIKLKGQLGLMKQCLQSNLDNHRKLWRLSSDVLELAQQNVVATPQRNVVRAPLRNVVRAPQRNVVRAVQRNVVIAPQRNVVRAQPSVGAVICMFSIPIIGLGSMIAGIILYNNGFL